MSSDRRKGRESDWRKTPKGCWSRSIGAYGSSVRILQREPRGVFYRIITDGRGRRDWKSLRTTSKAEAFRLGQHLYLALHGDSRDPIRPRQRAGEHTNDEERLTVGRLWSMYRESAAFRANTPSTQADKRSRGPLLVLGLCADTYIELLTPEDVKQYIELRQRGTGWADGRVTQKPRGLRTVEADLVLLRTMINWARRERGEDGRFLIDANPLQGVDIPKEKNPRRPVATYNRFERTLVGFQRLIEKSSSDKETVRLIAARDALRVAEATGRRIGSVRRLDWSDVDWRGGRLRWREATDKSRRQQLVALPSSIAGPLRTRWLAAGQPAQGFVFPSPRRRENTTSMLSAELRRAELEAGLEPLDGGLWHPFRRKWGSERKHMPIKDVTDAGGWSDITTFLTCYQHADDDSLEQVMESPLKLMEGEDGRRMLRDVSDLPRGGNQPAVPPGDGKKPVEIATVGQMRKEGKGAA